jgi:hypothetical protein
MSHTPPVPPRWLIYLVVATAIYLIVSGHDPARAVMNKIAGPGNEWMVWPAACAGLILFILWATRRKKQ